MDSEGVLAGVRILEVAEHTFVPAASAILSDWGADVIKVEHAVRGDAMRGLGRTGVMNLSGSVHVINEHSNRGKRSIGIDLATPSGREVLYAIARTSDVFLTNKRASSLGRLKLDVEALRAQNPRIIYVRGNAFGMRGPDAERGGYDMTAFWCRAGSAASVSPAALGVALPQPGPAYGDSIGGMTIAGGIAAALLKRERTGEASVVDVSLQATGMWAMSSAIALSAQTGEPWSLPGGSGPGNPLTGTYRTEDGRFLCFVMLQAFHYWPDFCRHIDRPDLIEDARFASHEALSQNASLAREEIQSELGKRTLGEWSERFSTLEGQWAPVQNTVEVASDPQTIANGYLQQTRTSDGTPFQLVTTPVQFDERPSATSRAPEFNEHGDEILRELGMEPDEILRLKAEGAVT